MWTAKTLIDWADAHADLSLRWVLRSFCWVLFVCVGVYDSVNNEVMSSRSVNSGTVPGQA